MNLSRRSSLAMVYLGVCLFLIYSLAGCGGGGSSGSTQNTTNPAASGIPKPTASIDQSGPILGKTTPLVFTFSEAMDTTSLRLGGVLAGESDGGVWSTTTLDNDTLTITPTRAWTTGDITIDASDLAGNALNTLRKSYVVKLVFNNFDAAKVEFGKADFTNSQGIDSYFAKPYTLYGPTGNPVVSTNGMLFIGDNNHYRVLGFNALPAVNNANADFVLGQPDFYYGTTPSAPPYGMFDPKQVSIAGGRLLVADSGDHRVLIYNGIPVDGTAVPDVVLGQPDFSTNDTFCDATHFWDPETVEGTMDGRVIVTDSIHNRVLIWNTVPTVNGQAPDLVLGQSNLTHCIENDDNQDDNPDMTPSRRTLSYPAGVWSDGTRVVVLDEANDRVLIWNSFPTSNFQPADVVLGQSDFTHNAINDDNQDGTPDSTPTARTLNDPEFGDGVNSNGIQLAVTDNGNNRVLIWNSFPTNNFQPADVVLGQADFTHKTFNDDNQDGSSDAQPSARTMWAPSGVFFYQDKLLVSDNDNNRLLIFQSR